jgi:hypothetical protein
MKIISGGQTGADRAGLDAALTLGLDYGGAVPRGRKAEDGMLPAKYGRMVELSDAGYPARTRKNVRDADATLIFTLGKVDRGTSLTLSLAERLGKPCLHIDLLHTTEQEATGMARTWLEKFRPQVLNIAGSRESTSGGIHDRVYSLLMKVLAK